MRGTATKGGVTGNSKRACPTTKKLNALLDSMRDTPHAEIVNEVVLRSQMQAIYTPENIGQQLAMRDLMADLRAANPLNQGGSGKGFTKADRSRFLDALEREMRQAKG